MWLSIAIQLFTFFLLILVWLGTIYTFWLTLFQPPFVPTVNKKAIGTIKDYLEQHPDLDLFYEPGCGFASVSRSIEKQFPHMKFVALEYNFFIFLLAKIWLKLRGSKIEIIWGDATTYDLNALYSHKQVLVYCYLLPELLLKMLKKHQFDQTKVLSLDFKIPGIEPVSNLQIGTNGFQRQIWEYNFHQEH